ncbi:MAG: glycosyltransferase [Flavobacteriales bacterium]
MSKKILIAPLDWGLGHASRCITLIRQQVLNGNEVVIAANGSCAALLQKQFPTLRFIADIPSYNIGYASGSGMVWQMMKQAPRIVQTIGAENKWLTNLLERETFDEVISDNRYGLHHENVTCTFITHQLFIRAPMLFRPLLNALVKKYVSRFDRCWIPDYEGDDNLSGALSHGKTALTHVQYIGPLSRFSKLESVNDGEQKYFALAIISGPEPQRTIFQNLITGVFGQTGKPCAILCGQPQTVAQFKSGNIDFFTHAEDEQFVQLVQQSAHIVCRSGYSTIMDLNALNRKVLLVPTPGQTEQEYLATFHEANGHHLCLTQHQLNIHSLLQKFEAL